MSFCAHGATRCEQAKRPLPTGPVAAGAQGEEGTCGRGRGRHNAAWVVAAARRYSQAQRCRRQCRRRSSPRKVKRPATTYGNVAGRELTFSEGGVIFGDSPDDGKHADVSDTAATSAFVWAAQAQSAASWAQSEAARVGRAFAARRGA